LRCWCGYYICFNTYSLQNNKTAGQHLVLVRYGMNSYEGFLSQCLNSYKGWSFCFGMTLTCRRTSFGVTEVTEVLAAVEDTYQLPSWFVGGSFQTLVAFNWSILNVVIWRQLTPFHEWREFLIAYRSVQDISAKKSVLPYKGKGVAAI
jgi:hypothetical protein